LISVSWWVLCVVRYRSFHWVCHQSKGFLPSVVCLTVIVRPWHWGDPGPLGAFMPRKNKIYSPALWKHAMLENIGNWHLYV
jgi:hypothetical protein